MATDPSPLLTRQKVTPSTYTGEIFGFINFEKINPMVIMAKTDLTNQRQVFVE